MAVPNPRSVFRLSDKVLPRIENHPKSIGRITLGKKLAGKRSVGKPQAAFEAEGDGNGAKEKVNYLYLATAPLLYPTFGGKEPKGDPPTGSDLPDVRHEVAHSGRTK